MIDPELFREEIVYVPNGKEIHDRRIELDLILRDVCERVGITAQFLCDIEHDRRGCSREVAEKLCKALKRR